MQAAPDESDDDVGFDDQLDELMNEIEQSEEATSPPNPENQPRSGKNNLVAEAEGILGSLSPHREARGPSHGSSYAATPRSFLDLSVSPPGARSASVTQAGEDDISALLSYAESLGVAATPSPDRAADSTNEIKVAGFLSNFRATMVISLPTLGPALRYRVEVDHPYCRLYDRGLGCLFRLDEPADSGAGTKWVEYGSISGGGGGGGTVARAADEGIASDRELIRRADFMAALLRPMLSCASQMARCEVGVDPAVCLTLLADWISFFV